VLFGPDAGQEVALPAAGVVVGADPACDVVLRDPSVSRRHATIVPTRGGFQVKDLSSRNGTWVDDVSVGEATVASGCVVRLGTTLLQLLPDEQPLALPPSASSSFGELRGSSLAMRTVFSLLERASESDAPILLLGESGTGKELAARAVHQSSPRADGPFVVFDCGAATESLIESELFGHKRGAFTGAHAERIGAFAAAHKGTLFLDEIGDLPLGLQPKLLRLLERGEVTPLGSRKTERYDVRFIAATHRDLWSEVGRGTFRGDLYYRLAVVEAHMPPLRKRASDIEELVRHFLRAAGANDDGVSGSPALQRLVGHAWPGNVRELRNVIARAVALAPRGARFADMPILLRQDRAVEGEEPLDVSRVRADVPYLEAKAALLAAFDRAYVTDALQRSGGNIAQAARIAGLERKHLYKVLERAGVDLASRKGSRDTDRPEARSPSDDASDGAFDDDARAED
jgi:DNA-binding NtrC family response regulator